MRRVSDKVTLKITRQSSCSHLRHLSHTVFEIVLEPPTAIAIGALDESQRFRWCSNKEREPMCPRTSNKRNIKDKQRRSEA